MLIKALKSCPLFLNQQKDFEVVILEVYIHFETKVDLEVYTNN